MLLNTANLRFSEELGLKISTTFPLTTTNAEMNIAKRECDR
jgi:hypothetical protein